MTPSARHARHPLGGRAQIQQLEGVSSWSVVGEADGAVTVDLKSPLGRDLRRQVGEMAVRQAWPVIELSVPSLSLEDAFIELIRKNTASRRRERSGRRRGGGGPCVTSASFCAANSRLLQQPHRLHLHHRLPGAEQRPLHDGFFLRRHADMRDFFGNLPLFLIFFMPALAMRLWAEDKRAAPSSCS